MGYVSWDRYAAGYRLAGDLAVEHAVTHFEQHILVYPAVFLYRQYIELRLKEIVINGNIVLGKSGHFPKHHKIDALWRECRDILEQLDKDELARLSKAARNKREADLDALQEDINKFSDWDRTSQAFRYPVGKNGNPSISISHLRNINLRNLQELTEGISYWLDGISVGVWQSLQDMNP